MRYLAISIIVATVLVIDYLANAYSIHSDGWDTTATIILIWAAIEWWKAGKA